MSGFKRWSEKWLQYSKIIVFVTGAVFIATLWFCMTRDVSGIYDASIYTVSVTITGGVFGSAIVWYEKKSQAENVPKIQLQHIRETADIEFSVYERKVRLQKELGIIGAPDIGMDDENNFHVDEQMSEAIDRDQNFLGQKQDEATSEPEMQTYG